MPARSDQLEHKYVRKAFTLVELLVVVVIMGIISVSVIPAMNNVSTIREGAARDDLVRYIEIARGKAVASGSPHGLEIDVASSTISLVQINQLGQIEPTFDPLTNTNRTLDLSSLYQGVTITSFTNGDGQSGSGILWFDFESTPHTRDSSGNFIALNNDPALIQISSDEVVYVYSHSGTLEVQR